ncbi:hypothetical protein IQ266_01420 [filamentous cyanobacterium LEGE 11480]|uniref:Uncharacterized protein n=1 Tax=Romeriopsis navalis LEGE 11480 TaxID=2777977 RepID=A0A928Z2R3_9CYAN|nr:hypothetical protein [Romeriopsis navalis]MBE9028413.1 hypothetical protein [Romeriopsis navalis LEGE 11480]
MLSFFQKRLPWLSLLLLFGSYVFIGRLLSTGTYSSEATWFLVLGSFAVALIYLHPLTDLNKLVKRWFSSDSVAFSAFVITAAAISFLLNWLKLFLPVVLILTTEGLARLDLQANQYSERQTFCLLVLITGLGLGCGWWLGKLA